MALSVANRLLRGVSEEELATLRPHLEEVTVKGGAVLAEAGEPALFVYFPETCVLSLVGITADGSTVEVAVVGPEGVASVSAALGRQRLPFRVVVQIGGSAYRVPSEVLTQQIHACRDLHERFLLYSHGAISQVAQSAICNRFHNAQQRLARWLLMTADRANSSELPLTHEFIADMVGGPRSAVTEAAAALRESGAIDYRRGHITIRNLTTLQQLACECYDAVNAPAGKK